MGTCQCYNHQSHDLPTLISPTLQPNNPIIQPPQQPYRQSIFINTHQPPASFAKPIDYTPNVPNKIIQTDKLLGTFKPEKDLPQYITKNNHLIKQPFRLNNGVIYQGQWKNGEMNGFGTMYLQDNSIIQGFFYGNKIVGQARFIKQNGDYYQGQVNRNQANGQGILHQNNITYKGQFYNNLLQGRAVQQSLNHRFLGQYNNGQKTFGKLIWNLDRPIPSVYQGSFSNSLFIGEAKLSNEMGEYKGKFQNGKKHGKGSFLWRNGDQFEGFYENDAKNGTGKMYNAKGIAILQGQWKNDKFVQ